MKKKKKKVWKVDFDDDRPQGHIHYALTWTFFPTVPLKLLLWPSQLVHHLSKPNRDVLYMWQGKLIFTSHGHLTIYPRQRTQVKMLSAEVHVLLKMLPITKSDLSVHEKNPYFSPFCLICKAMFFPCKQYTRNVHFIIWWNQLHVKIYWHKIMYQGQIKRIKSSKNKKVKNISDCTNLRNRPCLYVYTPQFF